MKSTANAFAARTGIDWADTKHDVCLQVDGESAFGVLAGGRHD